VPLETLDRHGRSSIHLARAQLCFALSDVADTRKELDAAAFFTSTDQADSVVESLHLGFASLALWDGNYGEGLRHNVLAHELSMRRGNEANDICMLANIAQCHGRLGHLAEQLTTAERARARLGTKFENLSEIQIPYWLGVAYAKRGETARVLDGCIEAEERLSPASPWWMSLWALHKADLLTLIGRYDQALETVRALDYREPYPLHFEGMSLRWHARAASSVDGLNYVADQLAKAAGRLDRYPMLDRAEILMARNYLVPTADVQRSVAESALTTILEKLPAAVTDHFRALTFLPF